MEILVWLSQSSAMGLHLYRAEQRCCENPLTQEFHGYKSAALEKSASICLLNVSGQHLKLNSTEASVGWGTRKSGYWTSTMKTNLVRRAGLDLSNLRTSFLKFCHSILQSGSLLSFFLLWQNIHYKLVLGGMSWERSVCVLGIWFGHMKTGECGFCLDQGLDKILLHLW